MKFRGVWVTTESPIKGNNINSTFKPESQSKINRNIIRVYFL